MVERLSDDSGAQISDGLAILAGPEHESVRAEALRVARRLRHGQRRVIGLLPASPRVSVIPIGVQLGAALAQLDGAPVALIDANLRWPHATANDAGDGSEPFATRWLEKDFALLSPTKRGAAGAGVPQLARVLQLGRARYSHLLVDLTGFGKLGEHLTAVGLTDGVVIIGRAGETREQELIDLTAELPDGFDLGVLLVGGAGR
jgi:hypothetical protein